MALSAERLIEYFGEIPRQHTKPVAAAKTVYKGGLVAPDSSGNIVAGGSTGALDCVGVSMHNVDNSAGAAGAKECRYQAGVHGFDNSSGDALTEADLPALVYCEDDQTVAKTDAVGTLKIAGYGIGLDSDGQVKVLVSPLVLLIAPLLQHVLSTQSHIPIPILAFPEADGTALAAFSDGASPTPGFDLVDSEVVGVRWNNHANPDPIGGIVPLPPDLDTAKDIVLHFLASKTGATVGDAVKWTAQVFFLVDGALHDADADAGGDSSAMTGDATAKTVQEETLTIAAADVPTGALAMVITIQPKDGTLGTDDVVLESAWAEYSRKLLTS